MIENYLEDPTLVSILSVHWLRDAPKNWLPDKVEQDFSTINELLSPEATALSDAEGENTEPDHQSEILEASTDLDGDPPTPVKVQDVDEVPPTRPQRMRKCPSHLSDFVQGLRYAGRGTALFAVEAHLSVTFPPEIPRLCVSFGSV